MRVVVLAGSAAIATGALVTVGSHPAFALYQSTCSASAFGSPVVYTDHPTAPLHVYAGSGGRTGTAAAATGVCMDPTDGFGGDFETGAGSSGQIDGTSVPVGVYSVVDGADSNPTMYVAFQPVGTSGYIGVSDYESGAYTPYAADDYNCQPWMTDSSGSNSGGAVMAKPLCTPYHQVTGQYGLPLPIACGFNSGPDWDNTPRDGCFFP